MRELRALGELGASGAGGLTRMVRDTHRAIAHRAFGAAGPGASPGRVVHDGISDAVYAAVRAGSSLAVRGGALAVAGRYGTDADSLADTPRGRLVLGALNGAWGDLLASEGSELAIEMDIPRLEEARSAATGSLVVFVHGLCENEDAWALGGRPTYGERLQAEHGWTPLFVRYNSGLHISDNGRRLAAVIEDVVAGWPVDVTRIALVGHSMGGLVARSAGQAATESGDRWVRHVTNVVCLGSPLNGADLEKGVNVVTWALGRLPETRAFADALRRRSAGIKDLRYGALTEDCWADCDPDELLKDRRGAVPWLEGVSHTFIAASLTRSADHPLGLILGDVLVRRPSAWAAGQHGEHRQFDVDRSHCIGGTSHFALLNHPDVYKQLERELGASEPAALTA